jgi:outer membrane protein assembly factor BamB
MDIIAVHSIRSGELLYSLQGRSILHENSVYIISNADGRPFRLVNYDLSAGMKRWETVINVLPVTELVMWEAIDAGNAILFCLQSTDYQTTVIALNNTNGKLLWKRDGFRILRTAYSWAPWEVGRLEGEAVILTAESQVLLVDKNTGKEIKSFSMAKPSVAAHDGKVFLSDRNTLKVLDLATSGLLWEKNSGGTITVSHDQVFVSEAEKFIVYDISTGSLLWEKKMVEPRLLLRRPGVLWVATDLFRTEKDPEGLRKVILKALHPETGQGISSFDFVWLSNGGPGILPIRMAASDGDSWKFDYLYGLRSTPAGNIPERVYITLKSFNTGTMMLHADTGKELWNTENLISHLSKSYVFYDVFLNVVYFYNDWFSGEREFLILDEKTGEITQHFTSYGKPLTIIGNQLLLVQRGDIITTLSSVSLNK